LEANGQLKRLMPSGLRHCESFAVIDAHAAGEIEPQWESHRSIRKTFLVPIIHFESLSANFDDHHR
jgi:hypothetical protein